MKALALLCLFVFVPPQTFKPETVALVFGPEPERVEFMATEDAESLYAALEKKRLAGTATEDDKRLHAALTQALGIIAEPATAPHVNQTRDRLDWEIRRGVRKPLQEPRRD